MKAPSQSARTTSALGPYGRPGQGGRGLVAGIDIGTTAVKAVVVDEDGNVAARVRLPSRLSVGPGDRLQHDAEEVWWEGPREVLRALFAGAGSSEPVAALESLAAVAVSAMMPSVGAVGDDGRPLGPGLLYGSAGPAGASDPTSSDEMSRLAALAASGTPGAQAYWPAQACANCSLGGAGVIDLASAFATGPLFSGSGWDEQACQRAGLSAGRMPRVAMFGEVVGELGDFEGASAAPERSWAGAVLGAGSVDGLCEQLVAGASAPGDVLVTLGSTLVVWLCVAGWPEQVPTGLWRVPHLAAGKAMVGGASNAGGLWVDWVNSLSGQSVGGPSPSVRREPDAASGPAIDALRPEPDAARGPAGHALRPEPDAASGRAVDALRQGRRSPAPYGGGASPADRPADIGVRPDDVPVFWPWVRGERVPWHDGSLRVGLAGAHLSHGAAHLRRAAFEATGFVVRYITELASACGTPARRYFVSGGGTAQQAWLRAMAEVLGAPVLPMAVPEGAALGAGFLARMAVGLETSLSDAARWARWAAPVEPRRDWAEAAGERYERWLQGLPAASPA